MPLTSGSGGIRTPGRLPVSRFQDLRSLVHGRPGVDIAQVARAWPSLARLGGRQQLQPRVQPQPERLRGTARSSALIGAAHCPTAERPASAARPRSSPLGRRQVVHPVAGASAMARPRGLSAAAGTRTPSWRAWTAPYESQTEKSTRPNLCSRSLTGVITTFARPATRVHPCECRRPFRAERGVPRSRSAVYAVAPYRVCIPDEAEARPFRGLDCPINHLQRLLQ